MPTNSGYVDYLNATIPARQAALAQRKVEYQQKIEEIAQKNAAAGQLAKSYSAPIVSGSASTMKKSTEISKAVSNTGKKTSTAAWKKASSTKKVRPTAGAVTQSWGGNKPQYSAGRHTGVDYGGAAGAAVKAAAKGTVVFSGSSNSYGNNIRIKHADGTTTLYAHLSRIDVQKGAKVIAGKTIGGIGNTGFSKGNHLHFEVRTRDRYGGDINPSTWFGR